MSEDLRSSVEQTEPRRRIRIVIAALAVGSLCCCASLALAWFYGDSVLEALRPFFQLQ